MPYIVTGTPGTGKTTFAKKYAQEHNLMYIDGKQIITDYNLVESRDTARDCDIIDEQKFADTCESLIAKNPSVIIDSHVSHYINPKLIDICFVTTCDISVLKRRLELRGYSDAKIRENLDAEIFQVCKTDAEDQGHTVEVVSTNL